MISIYTIRWLALLGFFLVLGTLGYAFITQPDARAQLFHELPDQRTLLAAAGVLFAIFAFFYNAKDRLDQARKQHTLKILFDTRLSSEFRQHLDHRKRYFPEGRSVDPEFYWTHINPAPGPATQDPNSEDYRKRQCAEAIRALLNYYEFLALGIARNDLDEDMLRGTLRGIMCGLVRDMYDVVQGHREKNPRTYKQLTRLYMRWKTDEDPAFPDVTAPRVLADLRRKIARSLDPL